MRWQRLCYILIHIYPCWVYTQVFFYWREGREIYTGRQRDAYAFCITYLFGHSVIYSRFYYFSLCWLLFLGSCWFFIFGSFPLLGQSFCQDIDQARTPYYFFKLLLLKLLLLTNTTRVCIWAPAKARHTSCLTSKLETEGSLSPTWLHVFRGLSVIFHGKSRPWYEKGPSLQKYRGLTIIYA